MPLFLNMQKAGFLMTWAQIMENILLLTFAIAIIMETFNAKLYRINGSKRKAMNTRNYRISKDHKDKICSIGALS